LPIIAQAINKFAGAVVMVCHDDAFVWQLERFEHIDLLKL
jgi:ATPase subunit of ABC transporter with duplicated ATPase domains